MDSSLSLHTVRNVSFTLVHQNNKTFLRCNDFGANAESRQVSVRVLTQEEIEKLRLKGSSSCCFCCRPSWIPVVLRISSQHTHLKIKVSEVAKKWGLGKDPIRSSCANSCFADLVSSILPKDSSSTVDPSEVSGRSDFGDDDRKESSDFLQKPPFQQLTTFFEDSSDETLKSETCALLTSHWPSMQRFIQTQLVTWQSSSFTTTNTYSPRPQRVETVASRFVSKNRETPFNLEFFFSDRTTVMYFGDFALNLVSGMLYQVTPLVNTKLQHPLRSIAQLAPTTPSIDDVRLSVISSSSGVKNYSLLVPYFGQDLVQAIEEGTIGKGNRDACTEQWLLALAAFHKEGICHGNISSSALLVRPHPSTRTMSPILGDFSRVVVMSSEVEKQDVHNLGVWLQKQLYPDIADGQTGTLRERTIGQMIQQMVGNKITMEAALKTWRS